MTVSPGSRIHRSLPSSAPAHSRGQALVEFAIGALVLAIMTGGTLEFGSMMAHKTDLDNAARAGARFAADNSLNNPTIWSNAASAPSNSIEGQVQAAGDTSAIPNDDSHIYIQYYDTLTGSTILCGHYSAASGSLVFVGTYTRLTCVSRANLVSVTVSSSYPLYTRILTVAPSLSSTAIFAVLN